MIHPTAIIDSKADIDSNVDVGPHSIVEANVQIGSGTIVGPHVVIQQHVTMGPDCHIFKYASIGAVTQAVKFKGEETILKIGRGTVVREFVTINRGTEFGGGITEIGEENFLMAYVHIAHDCKTGRRVILANNATLAGHIIIVVADTGVIAQFFHRVLTLFLRTGNTDYTAPFALRQLTNDGTHCTG